MQLVFYKKDICYRNIYKQTNKNSFFIIHCIYHFNHNCKLSIKWNKMTLKNLKKIKQKMLFI